MPGRGVWGKCHLYGRMGGEMDNNNQKCPMCGTKLKMINGRMTCKSCGYYIRNPQEEEAAGQASSQYHSQTSSGEYQNQNLYGGSNPYQGSGGQGNNPYQGSGGQGNPPYQGGSTGQQNRANPSGGSQAPTPGKSIGAVIAVAVIIGITVCVLVGIFFVNLFGRTADIINGNLQESRVQDSGSSSGALLDYIVDSLENEASSRGNEASSTTEETIQRRRVPPSSFFIQMAETIWGKGFRTITAEEYASLTALQINTDDKVISYQVNYGQTQTLVFQNYTDKDLSDLAAFPGLEFISIDDDLDEGDLDGLNNLNAIYSENSIEEILNIVPAPENITELGVESTFFEKSLEGLEAFPNLLYLSVNYDDLEDISILAQYPGLLGLTLEECDNLTDYSPLMSLTNLEVLGIESSELKSIDFIKAMPNLTHLRIDDSQITSLNALKSCPKLKLLSLTDNYYIQNDDYSVVGEMEMLEDLTIILGHHFTLPSFEKLTGLQRLSLKNAEGEEVLKDAVNVVSLILDDISWWDLEVLTSMQNLTSLTLTDSHLDTLEPLTRIPNLMALNLEGTNVYSNVEGIFGIPNLYYLNMNDCKVGMDFDNVPVSETLTILDLSELSVMEDPSFTSQNQNRKELASHYELFDCFPNVTELYLKSLRLDSIEFVKGMMGLELLDITDNNVTSLKPLEDLQYFQIVYCGKNTILENLSQDSKITVYMSD